MYCDLIFFSFWKRLKTILVVVVVNDDDDDDDVLSNHQFSGQENELDLK